MSDVSFSSAYRAAHGPRVALPYRSTYQTQYDLINQYHKLKQLTEAERERMIAESNYNQSINHHNDHHNQSISHHNQSVNHHNQSINQSINHDEEESKYADYADELIGDTSFVSDSATGQSVLNQLQNQSINQPINRSMNQPINQSINQPITQSSHFIERQLNYTDIPSHNYANRAPIVPKLNLPINQSIIQSINQSSKVADHQPDDFTPAHSYRQGYQSDDQSIDEPFIDSTQHSPVHSYRQPINQSINQSPVDSYRQPIEKSPIHSYRQPGNQSPIDSYRQPVNQPINQSPIDLYRQALNQSTINQSTEHSPIHSYRQPTEHTNHANQSINHSINQSSIPVVHQSRTPTNQPNHVVLITPNKAEMRPAGITRLNFDGVSSALYHNEKPINQPINQSINQPINQSINQSVEDPLSASRGDGWRSGKAILNQHQQLTDPITFRYYDSLESEPVSQRTSRNASGTSTPIYYEDDSINQSINQSFNQSTSSTPRSNTWMNNDSDVQQFSKSKLRLLKQRIDPSTVIAPAGMPSHRKERNKIAKSINFESVNVPRSCARTAAHGVLPTPPEDHSHHGKAHVPSYDQYVATQLNTEIRTSRRAPGTLSHAQVDHTTEILNFDQAVSNDRRSAALTPVISTRPLDSLFDIDYGFNKLTIGEIEREKHSDRLHYEKELARIREERVLLNAQLRLKRR